MSKEKMNTTTTNFFISINWQTLEPVLNTVDTSIIITDATGEIRWVNQAFSQVWGYTFEEYTATFGSNILKDKSNTRRQMFTDLCISEKEAATFQHQIITKNGKTLWLQRSITPVTNDSGSIEAVIVADADLTILRLAMQQINEQKQKADENMAMAIERQKKLLLQESKQAENMALAQKTKQVILQKNRKFLQKTPGTFLYHHRPEMSYGSWYFAATIGNDTLIATGETSGEDIPQLLLSTAVVHLIEQILCSDDTLMPAAILEQLHQLLHEYFLSEAISASHFTGASIGCLRFNRKARTAHYAGAAQPLYRLSHEKISVYEPVKGEIGQKQFPVSHLGNKKLFLPEGDALFLCNEKFRQSENENQHYAHEAILLDIAPESPKNQEAQIKNYCRKYLPASDAVVIGIQF